MIGDAFVFDGVAHPFNFEADNARGPAGQMFSNHIFAFHNALTPEGAATVVRRRVPAQVERRRDPRDGLPKLRH